MRSSYEIAEDIAKRVSLFRVVGTLEDLGSGYHEVSRESIDYWEIDIEKLKYELQRSLSETEWSMVTYDLFEEIVGELYCKLHSRLQADGFID